MGGRGPVTQRGEKERECGCSKGQAASASPPNRFELDDHLCACNGDVALETMRRAIERAQGYKARAPEDTLDLGLGILFLSFVRSLGAPMLCVGPPM